MRLGQSRRKQASSHTQKSPLKRAKPQRRKLHSQAVHRPHATLVDPLKQYPSPTNNNANTNIKINNTNSQHILNTSDQKLVTSINRNSSFLEPQSTPECASTISRNYGSVVESFFPTHQRNGNTQRDITTPHSYYHTRFLPTSRLVDIVGLYTSSIITPQNANSLNYCHLVGNNNNNNEYQDQYAWYGGIKHPIVGRVHNSILEDVFKGRDWAKVDGNINNNINQQIEIQHITTPIRTSLQHFHKYESHVKGMLVHYLLELSKDLNDHSASLLPLLSSNNQFQHQKNVKQQTQQKYPFRLYTTRNEISAACPTTPALRDAWFKLCDDANNIKKQFSQSSNKNNNINQTHLNTFPFEIPSADEIYQHIVESGLRVISRRHIEMKENPSENSALLKISNNNNPANKDGDNNNNNNNNNNTKHDRNPPITRAVASELDLKYQFEDADVIVEFDPQSCVFWSKTSASNPATSQIASSIPTNDTTTQDINNEKKNTNHLQPSSKIISNIHHTPPVPSVDINMFTYSNVDYIANKVAPGYSMQTIALMTDVRHELVRLKDLVDAQINNNSNTSATTATTKNPIDFNLKQTLAALDLYKTDAINKINNAFNNNNNTANKNSDIDEQDKQQYIRLLEQQHTRLVAQYQRRANLHKHVIPQVISGLLGDLFYQYDALLFDLFPYHGHIHRQSHISPMNHTNNMMTSNYSSDKNNNNFTNEQPSSSPQRFGLDDVAPHPDGVLHELGDDLITRHVYPDYNKTYDNPTHHKMVLFTQQILLLYKPIIEYQYSHIASLLHNTTIKNDNDISDSNDMTPFYQDPLTTANVLQSWKQFNNLVLSTITQQHTTTNTTNNVTTDKNISNLQNIAKIDLALQLDISTILPFFPSTLQPLVSNIANTLHQHIHEVQDEVDLQKRKAEQELERQRRRRKKQLEEENFDFLRPSANKSTPQQGDDIDIIKTQNQSINSINNNNNNNNTNIDPFHSSTPSSSFSSNDPFALPQPSQPISSSIDPFAAAAPSLSDPFAVFGRNKTTTSQTQSNHSINNNADPFAILGETGNNQVPVETSSKNISSPASIIKQRFFKKSLKTQQEEEKEANAAAKTAQIKSVAQQAELVLSSHTFNPPDLFSIVPVLRDIHTIYKISYEQPSLFHQLSITRSNRNDDNDNTTIHIHIPDHPIPPRPISGLRTAHDLIYNQIDDKSNKRNNPRNIKKIIRDIANDIGDFNPLFPARSIMDCDLYDIPTIYTPQQHNIPVLLLNQQQIERNKYHKLSLNNNESINDDLNEGAYDDANTNSNTILMNHKKIQEFQHETLPFILQQQFTDPYTFIKNAAIERQVIDKELLLKLDNDTSIDLNFISLDDVMFKSKEQQQQETNSNTDTINHQAIDTNRIDPFSSPATVVTPTAQSKINTSSPLLPVIPSRRGILHPPIITTPIINQLYTTIFNIHQQHILGVFEKEKTLPVIDLYNMTTNNDDQQFNLFAELGKKFSDQIIPIYNIHLPYHYTRDVEVVDTMLGIRDDSNNNNTQNNLSNHINIPQITDDNNRTIDSNYIKYHGTNNNNNNNIYHNISRLAKMIEWNTEVMTKFTKGLQLAHCFGELEHNIKEQQQGLHKKRYKPFNKDNIITTLSLLASKYNNQQHLQQQQQQQQQTTPNNNSNNNRAIPTTHTPTTITSTSKSEPSFDLTQHILQTQKNEFLIAQPIPFVNNFYPSNSNNQNNHKRLLPIKSYPYRKSKLTKQVVEITEFISSQNEKKKSGYLIDDYDSYDHDDDDDIQQYNQREESEKSNALMNFLARAFQPAHFIRSDSTISTAVTVDNQEEHNKSPDTTTTTMPTTQSSQSFQFTEEQHDEYTGTDYDGNSQQHHHHQQQEQQSHIIQMFMQQIKECKDNEILQIINSLLLNNNLNIKDNTTIQQPIPQWTPIHTKHNIFNNIQLAQTHIEQIQQNRTFFKQLLQEIYNHLNTRHSEDNKYKWLHLGLDHLMNNVYKFNFLNTHLLYTNILNYNQLNIIQQHDGQYDRFVRKQLKTLQHNRLSINADHNTRKKQTTNNFDNIQNNNIIPIELQRRIDAIHSPMVYFFKNNLHRVALPSLIENKQDNKINMDEKKSTFSSPSYSSSQSNRYIRPGSKIYAPSPLLNTNILTTMTSLLIKYHQSQQHQQQQETNQINNNKRDNNKSSNSNEHSTSQLINQIVTKQLFSHAAQVLMTLPTMKIAVYNSIAQQHGVPLSTSDNNNNNDQLPTFLQKIPTFEDHQDDNNNTINNHTIDTPLYQMVDNNYNVFNSIHSCILLDFAIPTPPTPLSNNNNNQNNNTLHNTNIESYEYFKHLKLNDVKAGHSESTNQDFNQKYNHEITPYFYQQQQKQQNEQLFDMGSDVEIINNYNTTSPLSLSTSSIPVQINTLKTANLLTTRTYKNLLQHNLSQYTYNVDTLYYNTLSTLIETTSSTLHNNNNKGKYNPKKHANRNKDNRNDYDDDDYGLTTRHLSPLLSNMKFELEYKNIYQTKANILSNLTTYRMLYPFSGFTYTALQSPYKYDLRTSSTIYKENLNLQYNDFLTTYKIDNLINNTNNTIHDDLNYQYDNDIHTNNHNNLNKNKNIFFARIVNPHKQVKGQVSEHYTSSPGASSPSSSSSFEDILIPCSIVDEYIPTRLFNKVLHDRYGIPPQSHKITSIQQQNKNTNDIINETQNDNNQQKQQQEQQFKNVKRIIFHPNVFNPLNHNGVLPAHMLTNATVEVFFANGISDNQHQQNDNYRKLIKLSYLDNISKLSFVGVGTAVL